MYQYPKNILSVQQQLQKLSSQGMEIDSPPDAEHALTSIGYYRLKGYCFHWFDKQANCYRPGTKFSQVLDLYHFDVALSHLLFGFSSQIEVALRVRMANALLIHGDALILNDPTIFKDKKLYWKNQATIASEINRSNDVFIKHNFDHYEGAVPVWAVVEVLSFGTLSKLIKTLKTGVGSAYSVLAQNYKFQASSGKFTTPSKDMLSSWIHSVSMMRNICAHNSRIYNRVINTRPTLIAADAVGKAPVFNGLYQILLAMKYLRPDDSSWNTFVTELKSLLQQYHSVVDINKMNFPPDWAQHM